MFALLPGKTPLWSGKRRGALLFGFFRHHDILAINGNRLFHHHPESPVVWRDGSIHSVANDREAFVELLGCPLLYCSKRVYKKLPLENHGEPVAISPVKAKGEFRRCTVIQIDSPFFVENGRALIDFQ